MRVATVLLASAVVVALMGSRESIFAQSPANDTFLRCGTPESREQCAKIDIETGHTRVMTFNRPFNEVNVGDPEIADVIVKGDRVLLIVAKRKVGTTNLVFFDNGAPMYSARIVVSESPSPFSRIKIHGKKDSIHDYFPYDCTSTQCDRLKEEYRGEQSREVFVPGLRPAPQLNIFGSPGATAPSPQRQGGD